MGDFDRFEKPNQTNETKKIIMVVGLGAALLCLVGYQMLKHGPQPANASGPGDVAEVPAVSETPELLRAALKADPTLSLLQSRGTVHVAAKPIRNPFRMGSAWLLALAPPPEVIPNRNPSTKPTIEAQTKPYIPTPPQAVRAEDFKLNTIFTNAGAFSAIINGKILKAGDIVGKARILEIRDDRVILQHVDFSDGPTTTLSMQPRLQ